MRQKVIPVYETYKPYYQGVIAQDQLENEAPFCDVRLALMNTFLNDNYGLIVLDGYTLAIIKTSDCFYIFDSHQRNCFGMPDPNGAAVVMKCNRYRSVARILFYIYIMFSIH